MSSSSSSLPSPDPSDSSSNSSSGPGVSSVDGSSSDYGTSSYLSTASSPSDSMSSELSRSRSVLAAWIGDTTPTSKKELRGWYLYDWANSVYSSVCIAIFMPVLVYEMGKRKAGVDPDAQCIPGEGTKDVDINGNEVKIQFGSGQVAPASVALFLVSISVAIQVVFFISHGALADFGHWRKKFLGFYAYLGAASTMAFIFFFDDTMWQLPGAFMVISNVFFGTSIVFYNSYLPVLIDTHPDVIEFEEEHHMTPDAAALEELKESLSNTVSTHGFASGYAAGTLLLIVSVAILFITGTDDLTGIRVCIFISGVWWAVFTIPTLLWIRARPGPPLPDHENYFLFSWKQVFKTLKQAKHYPHTFMFLGSFFIFSDGYSTIASAGVLFAAEELCMTSAELGIIALIPPLTAFFGNYAFLLIQRKGGFQTKTMLITNLLLLAFLPLWGLLGFATDNIGLRNKWEMYIFAVWYGFNLGAIQSFARVIYAALIPKGHESEYFSLFEITDKGSSWIGPLVVAAVRDETGSLRWGLFYLILFLVLPMFVLYFVDVKKGSISARQEPILDTLKVVVEHKKYADGVETSVSSTGQSSSALAVPALKGGTEASSSGTSQTSSSS
eukprot:TRINITY_DN9284_c0_g5_i1.p1 TRINITY_DN9284_c0_g5~~TRINITY_DN9284_c0_g5_i1.p1  ORF type:complete len:612 (-),score=126.14 TRINITY_DN9284_c0_g5_i1:103-1938(-)